VSLYVVVEGRKTEPKIYGAWLPLLIPGLARVARIEDAGDHHLHIVAGRGYPAYLDPIRAAVEDLRLPGSRFTHLLVCADAEELTLEERHAQIERVIVDAGCPVPHTVIVADCCMETWLLGNRRLVRRNPQSHELRAYLEHYDVISEDPEAIPAHPAHRTRAQLCVHYLRAVFRERKLSHSKRDPGDAIKESYLDALKARASPPPDGPGHLTSFARLLELPRRYQPRP
jgi:hypothetical protein